MDLDPFYLKTESEIKKRIDEWFNDLEYLFKIRVLLRFYSKYNIGKLEERGIFKLWKSIPLEEKKNLFQSDWQY